MSLDSLVAIKPEITLAIFGMVLLIYGAMRGDKSTPIVNFLALIGFVAAAGLLLCPRFAGGSETANIFGHMLVQDNFARFVKLIVLTASALSVLLAGAYLENEKLTRFEYPVLIVFATLGMMLMVSANDLLALYVGLELQSLALYVLAAFGRDDAKSSEAGLKYFVLGALSSGLILYGISLVYGYAGTTQFDSLAKMLTASQPALGIVFGLVFICAALAFKVSAVPFHMWTPDVYEGAPTPVTAFFAAAPKVAALALFTRVLLSPLGGLAQEWIQIVVFIAIASMILGAFAGLVQSNIKRLMAYSSIANVGYALVGLAAGGTAGVQALLIYLAIYFLNTLGAFAVIACLRKKGKAAEQINDLAGLARTNPLLALAMTVFMFSLAGVPPLAGFFGKYFVFLAAVQAHMVPLAIIGVLTSAVAAYYYLRIIKLMYFDDPVAAIDPVRAFGVRATLTISMLYMLLFVFWPAPLVDGALSAAHSLVGG